MIGTIASRELTKQQLAAALNCAGESIVITDRAGTIQYVNPSFIELSGYSTEEVLGQKPNLWRSDRHSRPFYIELWRTITSGSTWHGEVTNRKKDRSTYDCLLTIAPIWDERHGIDGYVSTISDISGYKTLQIQLRNAYEEAQRESKARWRALAYISHDIRTPLNGLLGILEILEDQLGESERMEYLATMKRAGQDILNLVENILDESKLDAQKLQLDSVAFDFRDSLKNVQQLLSSKAAQVGSTIRMRMPDKLPSVLGDPKRISRVLQNLVSNAVKFTEKGLILLTLDAIKETDSEIVLQLEIQDTGIGMSEATLANIFQDFSQGSSTLSKKFEGTGLGLSITKKFVDLMKGHIAVESEPGNGSTFTLTLPFAKCRPSKNALPASAVARTSTDFSGRTALVCDDDEMNRKIMQRILEKYGMIVDLANNGSEGIKYLEKKKYDIIFTDLHMPLVDGIAMAAHMRQATEAQHAPTTLVAITGDTREVENPSPLFADILAKPISSQNVLQSLHRFLHPTIGVG